MIYNLKNYKKICITTSTNNYINTTLGNILKNLLFRDAKSSRLLLI